MKGLSTKSIVQKAWKAGTVIPGFNIPYLPMMEPVVRALKDTGSFGLIMVARLEWLKFQSHSLKAIRDEYQQVKDENHTRLHLDHVPVIDEDNLVVDYERVIAEALELGYESVMVDGSRLPLAENIACTRKVVALTQNSAIAVEAELGAVMGHESGPLPPYEELFATGHGFTSVAEARQFVEGTGADWLSVAIGNIHGAISAAAKNEAKVAARLDIRHLAELNSVTGVPLVLHGGTGIGKQFVLQAISNGIAKINVATAIRQPYERALSSSVTAGQEAVYETMLRIIADDLQIAGSAAVLSASEPADSDQIDLPRQ